MMESFQVKLTLDESNLLYVLIYRGYSENAVTLSSIMEWVKGYHKKILKSIIKFDQEDIQSLNKQIQKKVVMADLMTDIIKTISEITFERFEQGVDLITKNGTFKNYHLFQRDD